MLILPYRRLLRLIRLLKLVLRKIARWKDVVLYVVILSATISVMPTCWRLTKVVAQVLMLPALPEPDVTHFMRNQNLRHYLSESQEPVVEPHDVACDTMTDIKILILIASVAEHYDIRQEIRNTWARAQPTFFVMGMPSSSLLQYAVKAEAINCNDIIVFDFVDHYQNLTLKSVLMLQYMTTRCPHVEFFLKTDEDVFVNPWMLQEVIQEHPGASIIGFSINNTKLHRDPFNKYYVPRWLYRDNSIDQYLSGTGYLVKGSFVEKILKSSYSVPLVNIEDVYITYLVAKRALNLTLTHDSRLNPMRPWSPFVCSYWNRAIVHNVKSVEVSKLFIGLTKIYRKWKLDKGICNGYSLIKNDFSVFWHLFLSDL